MTDFALTGARIFDGSEFYENSAVIVKGNKITGIRNGSWREGIPQIKLGGGYLVPGFIDVQVNGGGGALLNQNPNIDTVRKIATSHRRFGTTGMLPTVITDAPEVITAAIAAVSHAVSENMPCILGIHIEGPFLDVKRKGAHAAKFIRKMTAKDIRQLTTIEAGVVLLTVAPNCVTPKQISDLTKHNIVCSLGHSDATSVEAQDAVAAGATAFTHLFNAMSQMTSREPGMVGAALTSNAYVGLIADGHHVHPHSLQAAIRAKGIDRCMLISDAMPSAASGPATFKLQGRTVTRKRGRLTLKDGTLAGSNLTMDAAVRYCVTELGLELGDTLRMASRTPAEFLGLGGQLGQIRPGYLASLVHLGDDLTVKRTWINGT
jgi:N-acetylglucosamine-6-phosphate deacetylase